MTQEMFGPYRAAVDVTNQITDTDAWFRDNQLTVPRTTADQAARSVPLASGPEYLVRAGDRLYVRCCSTDYVFGLGVAG